MPCPIVPRGQGGAIPHRKGVIEMEKAKKTFEVVESDNSLETLLQKVSAQLIEEIKNGGASKRERVKLAKIFTRLARQYA
jgi:hypothetical protein